MEIPISNAEFEKKEEKSEKDLSTSSESDTVPKIPAIPDRVLLGEAINGQRPVYWEYGHPELSNRHIIIFGTSGMGKTYAIQCLLWELSKKNNNSLIVDYTNGFFDNQLEPEIKDSLNPIQHVIQKTPLDINPFRRQIQDINIGSPIESPITTAQRVSGVFSKIYDLGAQQKSALYQAIKELIRKLKLLEAQKGVIGSSGNSLISKIQPFVDQNPFGTEDKEGWNRIYNDSINNCHIIQLAGFLDIPVKLIIEFLLIDLYWYYRSKGNQNNPRVLVLDEVQNLDHSKESPLAQ